MLITFTCTWVSTLNVGGDWSLSSLDRFPRKPTLFAITEIKLVTWVPSCPIYWESVCLKSQIGNLQFSPTRYWTIESWKGWISWRWPQTKQRIKFWRGTYQVFKKEQCVCYCTFFFRNTSVRRSQSLQGSSRDVAFITLNIPKSRKEIIVLTDLISDHTLFFRMIWLSVMSETRWWTNWKYWGRKNGRMRVCAIWRK